MGPLARALGAAGARAVAARRAGAGRDRGRARRRGEPAGRRRDAVRRRRPGVPGRHGLQVLGLAARRADGARDPHGRRGPRRAGRHRPAPVHGARARVQGGEHRRQPDREPGRARLPGAPARGADPRRGGRHRDARRRGGREPARALPVHHGPGRCTADQAEGVQRRARVRHGRVPGHLRRGGQARAGPAEEGRARVPGRGRRCAACRTGVPGRGRAAGLRPGGAQLLQRGREPADPDVHAGVLVLVRLHAARAGVRPAGDPARRHVEPLPGQRPAPRTRTSASAPPPRGCGSA